MPKREAVEEGDVVSQNPPTKKNKKPLPKGYKCNCCGEVEAHAVYGKMTDSYKVLIVANNTI